MVVVTRSGDLARTRRATREYRSVRVLDFIASTAVLALVLPGEALAAGSECEGYSDPFCDEDPTAAPVDAPPSPSASSEDQSDSVERSDSDMGPVKERKRRSKGVMVLGIVFVPVGAVALGAGITLYVTGPNQASDKQELHERLGAGLMIGRNSTTDCVHRGFLA